MHLWSADAAAGGGAGGFGDRPSLSGAAKGGSRGGVAKGGVGGGGGSATRVGGVASGRVNTHTYAQAQAQAAAREEARRAGERETGADRGMAEHWQAKWPMPRAPSPSP